MEELQMSLKLYSVLEFVGASEDARLVKRRLTNEAEMLDTIHYYNGGYMSKFPRRQYIVGSYYEASVTPDLLTDIDTVFVNENAIVITEIGQKDSCPINFLLIKDVTTFPGYVKLQPILLDEPLTVHSRMPTICFLKLIFNPFGLRGLGHQYSSDRHGNICYNNDSGPLPDNYFNMKKNGPAWALYELDGQHEFDHVYALECDKIPKFAIGWVSRQRKYGWPSKQLLDELSRANNCLFVPKGHENSTESNLEWRISFTLQERKLMTSLNPVQHKIYVLLKMIKREIVQRNPELDGVISSYELKTCLLHVIENTPARYWEKANLVSCLLYTLSVFNKWICNRHCPNFFIPEQNLFFRSSFKHKQKVLTKVLKTFLIAKHELVLKLHCDHVGELLTQSDVNSSMHLRIAFKWYCFHHQMHLFVVSKLVACSRYVIFNFRPHHPRHIGKVTRSIMQYRHLRNYEHEERCKIVSYIIPWVHLHVAVGIACNPQSVNRAEEAMLYHFDQAKGTDCMNQRLTLATVYLSRRYFSKALELLEQLDIDVRKYNYMFVKSFCCCRNMMTGSRRDIFCPLQDITVEALLKTRGGYCVMFLPSESAVVPAALHYEMHRGDSGEIISDNMSGDLHDKMIVDSKIYLYFLFYLVHNQLENDDGKSCAIKTIHLMLRVHKDLNHRETAYNQLGWIYMQEKLYGYAARCFMMSWDYQKTYNAAKLHVWDLIKKLKKTRRKKLLRYMRLRPAL